MVNGIHPPARMVLFRVPIAEGAVVGVTVEVLAKPTCPWGGPNGFPAPNCVSAAAAATKPIPATIAACMLKASSCNKAFPRFASLVPATKKEGVGV